MLITDYFPIWVKFNYHRTRNLEGSKWSPMDEYEYAHTPGSVFMIAATRTIVIHFTLY